MPFDASAWQQAAEDAEGGGAPPDAEYDVELVNTKIATRERDGAQWVVLKWKVLAGRERDVSWESMHTIDGYKPDGETNPGLAYTIQSLAQMGLSVKGLNTSEELEDALAPLEGRTFAVQVKRSGSFVNTYPQRPLEHAAASLPGTGGYGERPAASSSASSAIYGGDAPERTLPPDPPPPTHQTTPEEFRGTAPIERTGESDVTPPGAAAELRAESERAAAAVADERDLPWNERTEPPPQRGDIDPETGEPIPF